MKSLCCYASAFAACLGVLQAVAVSANTITIQVGSTQSSIPSGGSVFNPFPLAGASAPIATSGPNVFSPSPSTPVVQPVPPTGVGIFNPFPLSGATLPLSTVGGTVPNPNPAPGGAGVFTSPGNGAAAGATTVIPSTTPTVTSTGV